ncbi:MAG: hypothetical protein NC923_01950, partial [Candidatus Omnitrophica bacterium]|nr:hypothetical protein [Candidatus Omnitrophota bacterium]
DQLREKALATAKGIDIDVYKFMQDLIELYNQDIISEKKLKGLVLTLRRSLLKKDLNIFLFSFALFKEKEDRIYLLLVPFRIKQRIELNNATIQGLNLPGEVLERLPLYAYAVDNHPLGEDVMAKGVYKGHSDEEGYYALCYIGSTGPDSEKIDWV